MGSSVLLEASFNEVAKTFIKDTSSVKDKLYKIVESKMSSSKIANNYRKCVAKFMETRANDLYDNLPCSRIPFGEEDKRQYFEAMEIDPKEATEAILGTFYGEEPNFSPIAAKDEFTVTQMCVIRYYLMKNMNKDAELAMVYLAFSGKFYPSLHYRSFNYLPARHVMEYTVNNVLSSKFDLIAEGNVIASVRKIGNTWMNKYKPMFKKFDDDAVVYMIQQLYSRIGSFIKNIASDYYDTYNKKDDLYIAYASDSLDEDDYHLADNDTLKVSKITEKTTNYITTSGVDYSICKMCSDSNISINEIKSIMESIISEPSNMLKMKELISLMVTTYFASSKEKDVTRVEFITYSIAAKPNAKQPEIVRQKEIIEEFLVENSTAYVRRRSRLATRNSYERAIRMYFALAIHNSNR